MAFTSNFAIQNAHNCDNLEQHSNLIVLEKHGRRPKADLLLLVHVVILGRPMIILDIATKCARRARSTVKVLQAKDRLEDMHADL